jgi:hypothetical protein
MTKVKLCKISCRTIGTGENTFGIRVWAIVENLGPIIALPYTVFHNSGSVKMQDETPMISGVPTEIDHIPDLKVAVREAMLPVWEEIRAGALRAEVNNQGYRKSIYWQSGIPMPTRSGPGVPITRRDDDPKEEIQGVQEE